MISQMRFTADVVERKVNIVGNACKNLGQIAAQGICHKHILTGRQLGLQLCFDVGDQLQLILHFEILTTVAHIFIDCRTGSKADQQGQAQYPINYVPLSSSHTHNVCARTLNLCHQHTGEFFLPN